MKSIERDHEILDAAAKYKEKYNLFADKISFVAGADWADKNPTDELIQLIKYYADKNGKNSKAAVFLNKLKG